MYGSIYTALALIAALASADRAAFAADAEYAEEAPELCAIYFDESTEGTYLTAYAAEGIAGEYVFNLRQAGPGGTSQITQSGEFEPALEGPTLLSEVMLDLDGEFEASLQTYTGDGEFVCRAIV